MLYLRCFALPKMRVKIQFTNFFSFIVPTFCIFPCQISNKQSCLYGILPDSVIIDKSKHRCDADMGVLYARLVQSGYMLYTVAGETWADFDIKNPPVSDWFWEILGFEFYCFWLCPARSLMKTVDPARRLPGNIAARPRPLQIVASARAVHIEQLPCEI